MYPNVASKPISKNEYTEYHGISIPFKSQDYGCLDYEDFGKGKVFSKNSNLSNLVNIQR